MLSLYNPRQTVLIGARAEATILGKKEVKDNLLAVDWHMPVSFEPLLYAISIGKKRFSRKLIEKSGVFVVNFMPFAKKDDVLYCGRHSGQYLDKFSKISLTKVEASRVDCCAIKESAAWIECSVEKTYELGDHIVFIGNIVGYKENKKSRRLFHVKGDSFTTTR